MRILLINPNTSAAVTAMVAARVSEIVGSSVTIVPVTGRFGARYIASRAAAAIAGHAALEALAEHVGGSDVVVLACFGDPGLAALKEISPVPVVGMAEASCRLACARADRFAIVTGGAAWEPMLREFVAELGLADRLASIRTIARTGGQIAAAPVAALDELASACRACVIENGADTVILGGAGLVGLARQIQGAVPVPIICSVEAVAQAARDAYGAAPRVSLRTAIDSVGLAPALAKLLGTASHRM